MSDSLRIGPGDGFGEFVCLSIGSDPMRPFSPHARRTPCGIDIVTRSGWVTGEFIRLTRSEVATLVRMLPELGIDLKTGGESR